jgi:hypothetical protein
LVVGVSAMATGGAECEVVADIGQGTQLMGGAVFGLKRFSKQDTGRGDPGDVEQRKDRVEGDAARPERIGEDPQGSRVNSGSSRLTRTEPGMDSSRGTYSPACDNSFPHADADSAARHVTKRSA